MYKKGAKKSQLPIVNSNKLHMAIICKFRATAIFSSFLIKMVFRRKIDTFSLTKFRIKNVKYPEKS